MQTPVEGQKTLLPHCKMGWTHWRPPSVALEEKQEQVVVSSTARELLLAQCQAQ